MLGRYFQLSADMVLDKFFKKFFILVFYQIVITYAAAHEHFFHSRQFSYTAQNTQIFRMVGLHRGTRIRSKAPTVRAKAFFVAGGVSEIRGRASDIVDISLEIRRMRYLGFAHDAVLGSRSNIATLMKHYRAEVAAAETAAVMRDGMFDLRDCGNAADIVVNGVPRPHERQVVNIVQILAVKRQRRRILLDPFIAVTLNESFSDKGILLSVLNPCCVRILFFACFVGAADLFKRGTLHGVRRFFVNNDAGSRDVRQCGNRLARRKARHYLFGRSLAHAETADIRAAVKQYRTSDPVAPIVVMGKAAQRRFKPADNKRNISVSLSDTVAINDNGAVGAFARLAACGVRIVTSSLLCGGVVIDHGINTAARYEKRILRSAVNCEIFCRTPIGL